MNGLGGKLKEGRAGFKRRRLCAVGLSGISEHCAAKIAGSEIVAQYLADPGGCVKVRATN
jgi:hypothetical protein